MKECTMRILLHGLEKTSRSASGELKLFNLQRTYTFVCKPRYIASYSNCSKYSGRCNRINWCCGANLAGNNTSPPDQQTHTHIVYIDPTFSINADSTRSFLPKVREGERLYGKNNKILAWGEQGRQRRRGRRSTRGRKRSAVFLQLSPFFPSLIDYFTLATHLS